MPNKVTILGGTGFVGSQLTIDLARHFDNVTVLTRRKNRFRDLKVLTNVHILECDVHNPDELRTALADSDVVVNLVGILNQSGGNGKNSFFGAHAELTRKLVDVLRESNVSHYLHMSSLGADAEEGSSEYLKSKGEAERHIESGLYASGSPSACKTTIFRPSVIFGESDSFFNRFAPLLRGMLVFPLACPDSRMSPVYVEDLCNVMSAALGLPADDGSDRFAEYLEMCRIDKGLGLSAGELCGPKDYTLRELVQFTADTMGIKRKIVGLPDGLARLQGKIMGILPAAPFSTDNYLSLQTDSVCENENCRLPTSIEAIVPRYLGNQGLRGEQQRYRSLARR